MGLKIDSKTYAVRLKNKINMCIYFYTAVQYIKVNKNLREEDIYSWYTFANNTFKEFDLNIENYSNIDKSFEKVKYFIKIQLRKVVTEKYRNKFKEKLHHPLTNLLFLYSKLKSKFSIGLKKIFIRINKF